MSTEAEPTTEQATEQAIGPVHSAVQAYAELQPRLLEVTDAYIDLITRLLDDAGINYLSVTGRAKSVPSFAAKANRSAPGTPTHDDPMVGITDQVGVRVITYVLSDVAAVADLLADQLHVLDDRDMAQETASKGSFGYASRHVLVEDARQPQVRPASVQIRTVLQHAWAEFEHDIRYKGTVPAEHARDFDRRFTLAAGLLELADQEFTTIRARLRGPVSRKEHGAGHIAGHIAGPESDDPRLEPREVAAFLAGQYADAGWSRADHYDWIAGLLPDLGVTTLADLGDVLADVDEGAIKARMDYRYPPGAVRRLDDALLSAFGERYVALPGNAHREAALRTRLERIRG
ncbi:MAG: GTP pyrophosphokinase family protein [Marmoricola sp.]